MNDFLNFERKKCHFHPYVTHLDVFVGLRKINIPVTNREKWTYKLKMFCLIPILLFQCKSMGSNILLHLNYPELIKLNATSWLESDCLTFMIFLSDTSISNDVVCAKTMQLSKSESNRIREACSKQSSLGYQTIEDLVDIIYEQDIKNIWSEDPDQTSPGLRFIGV